MKASKSEVWKKESTPSIDFNFLFLLFYLSRFWNGQVKVQTSTFVYFKPLFLKVVLYDIGFYGVLPFFRLVTFWGKNCTY